MNMREIDLNLLVVFEAIYSVGNISRAADKLNLTQPALSNALARLRKQLDNPLFVRSGNGVVPTALADEIIDPIRDALFAIEQSIMPKDAFDPAVTKRHFRLIVADPLEQIVMGSLLRTIGHQSQISFELQPPQTTNIETALLEGNVDLAVFLMPIRVAELNNTPLCSVDPVIIARHDHPRVGVQSSREEVMREGVVSLALSPGKLENSEKVNILKRFKVRQVCQVSKVSSIAQLVSESDLVGFIPSIYARKLAPGYGLQILKVPVPEIEQKFQLIWHRRFDSDVGHTWLRDNITRAVVQAQDAQGVAES
ncbi:MAG: LysR family transcriptional regulator [Pseudomonadota bacterium]